MVPSTAWRDKVDWCEDLLGERAPGLRRGELDGVIFKEAPGPASFDFALRGAVVAIAPGGTERAKNQSPLSGRDIGISVRSGAFVADGPADEDLW